MRHTSALAGALAGALLIAGPALADNPNQQPVDNVVSTAAEASHVVCSSGCVARSFYVTLASAVSGYIMTFNATTAPADGDVTPRECIYISGPNTVSLDFADQYDPYPTGMVAVFSTTGCFTKTASASAFFKIRKQ
jgi:hypothetical protein